MATNETADGGALTPPVGPDDHVRGPADAPATVVVYGDYQCPYTRRALNAIRALEGRIGDRFRLVYRHFPLREIHPNAEPAAELAEAAADRGKFWEVHDHLFANQDALDPYHLNAYAAQFEIPGEGDESGRFEAGNRYADRVEEDFQGGLRSGVGGTPAIYVNGRPHRGGYDEATLQRAIELAR
jgi:protein-disulfide isomerase